MTYSCQQPLADESRFTVYMKNTKLDWYCRDTEKCLKCGWGIYTDLEDHYWEAKIIDNYKLERWQHKDCYEMKK